MPLPFLEALAAERGAAANTLAAYDRDLAHVQDWLDGRGAGFRAGRAGRYRILPGALRHAGLARATRARRLSAVKQLYRFAFEEGLREDNPALQISGPGRDKRLPKTLSDRRGRPAAGRGRGARPGDRDLPATPA